MTMPQAEPTPNPNSLKFTIEQGSFLQSGMAAYTSKEEADDDPLARELFSVGGVDDVFITSDFVTVSKTPNVPWNEVQPEIEKILADYLDAA